MSLFCATSRCWRRGWHDPVCTREDCAGCQRWPAADGWYLCQRHGDEIGPDAHAAAALYAELALVLSASEGPGEKTSGSKERSLPLNDRAAESRTQIRHVLVSWSKMIAEERGVTLPPDDITSIGSFLAKHGNWLAAHPAAGECADELHELAHGRPWRVAYPTGARVFVVGVCPHPLDDRPCPGLIRAILRRTDSLLPSELVCDYRPDPEPEGWVAHRWTADQWREMARALRPDGMVQRTFTAYEIATEWRLPLGTVYRLAHDNQWRRVDDGKKPALYEAADVEATMRKQTRRRAS